MAAFAGWPLAYGGARAAGASVSVRAEKAVTSNKIGCAQPSLAGRKASGSSEARPPLCFALTAARPLGPGAWGPSGERPRQVAYVLAAPCATSRCSLSSLLFFV
jgi:hypothetical protein